MSTFEQQIASHTRSRTYGQGPNTALMRKIPMIRKARHVTTFAAIWRYRYGLLSMFADMFRGRYKASFLTVVTIVASLIYIVSPVDLVPDFIPVVGWLDDGAVFYFLLKRLMYELTRYSASSAVRMKNEEMKSLKERRKRTFSY